MQKDIQLKEEFSEAFLLNKRKKRSVINQSYYLKILEGQFLNQ